jgi:hypothetical protein
MSPVPTKALIDLSVLEQVDVRVGTIESVCAIEGATKLVKLAVISESIGIPPHLSLPGRSTPALVFEHDLALGHIENAMRSQHPANEKEAMTTQGMHSDADELEVQRRDICAQFASQAQQ